MRSLWARWRFYGVLLVMSGTFLIVSEVRAASGDVPAAQTAGGIQKLQSDIDQSKALESKILDNTGKNLTKEKTTAVIGVDHGEKVFISRIVVEGVRALTDSDIARITGEFENKQISFAEMQKAADLITDAYRAKGYVTARAFIPRQTIKQDGVLLITVVESTVGNISITGNKYFKTRIYEEKLRLKPGEPFNYAELQKSLVAINEKPDRSAKVVLAPGKVQGGTDIIIEAKDRLPVHAGYTFNNYGSRYAGRNLNFFTLEHNNLTGSDDQLFLQYMVAADSELANYKSGRYLFPLTKTTNIGLTGSVARSKLGSEFLAAESIGKSTVLGAFVNQALISNETLDVRANLGFDYKSIKSYLQSRETSRDDSRVAKIGLDVDKKDFLGRTLFTAELDNGIPDMWGGLSDKDPRASRTGSGGKFLKGVFNLYRAQPLPLSAALLFKNSAQYTNSTLTAAEEFQVGGPYSVRGYAPAAYAGDRGLYSAVELVLPYYFIPRSWTVPFTNSKWYDTARFVMFYDWATVRMSDRQLDESKGRTIKGCGLGARFNITNRISVKAEFGYPLGGPQSTDTKHRNVQPWVEVAVKF
ncbi:MAG: ShlB/FhaC/HecB family hemolysin secretion/activation protein [Candidatus Omnitrophica bacterium]|nr:ShlB/FhaC/HecB family hemolysin secretion/activation protein [Candidatus Omnitrophota bacterium]